MAEAKAAGAQTLAPEEYAHAEGCLDWWTHYVTQFDHIGDATMANLPARCRAAMQALKGKMAAAAVAKAPEAPVPPPVEAPQAELAPPLPPPPAPAPEPEVDRGIYPKQGTLEETLAALPPVEAPPVPEEAPPAPAEVPPAEPPAPPVPAPPAPVPPAPAPTPPPPVAEREPEKKPPLEDIFFDYDQSSIRPQSKKTLDQNVEWLRANAQSNLIIEGHCDERGTREYNLALGQRRAKAAQDYLVASGIDEKRIKIISYGRERPFVVGHDETAWQWNRRAHFLLP